MEQNEKLTLSVVSSKDGVLFSLNENSEYVQGVANGEINKRIIKLLKRAIMIFNNNGLSTS